MNDKIHICRNISSRGLDRFLLPSQDFKLHWGMVEYSSEIKFMQMKINCDQCCWAGTLSICECKCVCQKLYIVIVYSGVDGVHGVECNFLNLKFKYLCKKYKSFIVTMGLIYEEKWQQIWGYCLFKGCCLFVWTYIVAHKLTLPFYSLQMFATESSEKVQIRKENLVTKSHV